jgi:hypothetical protein
VGNNLQKYEQTILLAMFAVFKSDNAWSSGTSDINNNLHTL